MFQTYLFHSAEPKKPNEINKIINGMRVLDISKSDVDQICWKMLTGEHVSRKEKTQLNTLFNNIVQDLGMKIIIGTSLASSGEESAPLKGTYMFRYTMELIKNIYDSHVEMMKLPRQKRPSTLIYRCLHSENEDIRRKMTKILAIVLRHFKPQKETTSFEQFDCWKRIVSLNAETIQNFSHMNRMLTLDECQQIDLPVPEPLRIFSGRVRAVNAFSVRVLNTPYKPELDVYNSKSLAGSTFTHVAGSSERSQKTYSNKSVAMSLTDEMSRAIKYGVFYAQVIPLMIFIQVKPETTIKTTTVLEYGEFKTNKKYAQGQAYKIAEGHHEYIPLNVSVIAPSSIVDMRFLVMKSGPVFVCGPNLGPKYPKEFWVKGKNSVYVNKRHQDEARNAWRFKQRNDVSPPTPSSNTSTPRHSPKTKSLVNIDVVRPYRKPKVKDHVEIKWRMADKTFKWFKGTITKIDKEEFFVKHGKSVTKYNGNILEILSKNKYNEGWRFVK